MSKIISQSFLISCVGAYGDSGIGTGGYLLAENGEHYIIDHYDCTGLYEYKSIYFRFIRGIKLLIGYNEMGVCYTCKFPQVQDCHDISIEQDIISFVSTHDNKILRYSLIGELIESIKMDGEGDAWHLNCLESVNNKSFITAFGKFSTHREWSKGCTESGFLMRISDSKIIIDGLSGPHHPRFIDNKWFVCDSHRHSLRVVNEDGSYKEIFLGGFTRGFCYDDKYLYVGVNADRKSENPKNSFIVCLDRSSLLEVDQIELPFPEIYDILICKKTVSEAIKNDIASFRIHSDNDLMKMLQNQVTIGHNTYLDLLKQKNANTKPSLLKRLKSKIRRILKA